MYSAQHIALYEQLFSTATEHMANRCEKTAAVLPPKMLGHMLGAAGVGGLGVGIPLYLIKDKLDHDARMRTRDRAFGAGLATGVHAPQMMQTAFAAARDQPEIFLGGGMP